MNFDLVNVFPVVGRPHSYQELELARHGLRSLRIIPTFNNEVEAALDEIKQCGRGDSSPAISSALKKCKDYKKWKAAMVPLKDVPSIHEYRVGSGMRKSPQLVNEEILAHGAALSVGQVLYRGAVFGAIDFEESRGPVSTSMLPSVAYCHAIGVGGSVGILRVVDGAPLMAYAFRTAGNELLTHEYEVLLQSCVRFKFVSVQRLGRVDLFEYYICGGSETAIEASEPA